MKWALRVCIALLTEVNVFRKKVRVALAQAAASSGRVVRHLESIALSAHMPYAGLTFQNSVWGSPRTKQVMLLDRIRGSTNS